MGATCSPCAKSFPYEDRTARAKRRLRGHTDRTSGWIRSQGGGEIGGRGEDHRAIASRLCGVVLSEQCRGAVSSRSAESSCWIRGHLCLVRPSAILPVGHGDVGTVRHDSRVCLGGRSGACHAGGERCGGGWRTSSNRSRDLCLPSRGKHGGNHRYSRRSRQCDRLRHHTGNCRGETFLRNRILPRCRRARREARGLSSADGGSDHGCGGDGLAADRRQQHARLHDSPQSFDQRGSADRLQRKYPRRVQRIRGIHRGARSPGQRTRDLPCAFRLGEDAPGRLPRCPWFGHARGNL